MKAAPVWHVLGAGAIGLLWAARLSNAGVASVLCLRERGAVRGYPGQIRLSGADDIVASPGARAPDQPGDAIEHLLVCVKAQHTAPALQAWRPQLADGGWIVLLQNGMGAADEARRLCPTSRVLTATTTHGAYRPGRWHSVHAGVGETHIGSDAGTLSREAAEPVLASLARTGLGASWDASIGERLWAKLAVNAIINPLTALWRCRNGELFNRPDRRALILELCTEISALDAARGVSHPDAQQLFDRARQVSERTAANYSSMYQDVTGARSTEIDYISGALLRTASRLGVAMPRHEMLQRLIRGAQGVDR